MTKAVIVKISGLQFGSEGGDDAVEMITSADYYKKNGKHYIIFDEVAEGFSEATRNIMKLNEDSLEITKRGVANVHMMFEKDKKNMSYYHTPYGSILIGIDAKKLELSETEERIGMKVEYALEMNYEHTADCEIMLEVCARGNGDFRI